jgi:hypothetical protein
MRECHLLGPGETSCFNYNDLPERCETACIANAGCDALELSFCGGKGSVGICLANCVNLPPVTCGNGSQLSGYARCNGVPECSDGADEAGCSAAMIGSFKCRGVDQFVPFDVQCDGRSDCSDGSDEIGGCETVLTCGAGIKVPARQRCDGIAQCPDGADEPASCAQFTCP